MDFMEFRRGPAVKLSHLPNKKMWKSRQLAKESCMWQNTVMGKRQSLPSEEK